MKKTQAYKEAYLRAEAWIAANHRNLADPRCGHDSEIFVTDYQANEGWCDRSGAHLVHLLAYGCAHHEDGHLIPGTTFERYCPFQKCSRPYLACDWSRVRTFRGMNREVA